MITDYKVISSGNPKTVEKEVKALMFDKDNPMDDGWEPSGPLTCQVRQVQCRYSGSQRMSEDNRLEYTQAMVKKVGIHSSQTT